MTLAALADITSDIYWLWLNIRRYLFLLLELLANYLEAFALAVGTFCPMYMARI